MKIFNIDQYNEKLKINPVSQSEFDKIHFGKVYKKYFKALLKTGDVCQIRYNDDIGVAVMDKTIDLSIFNLDTNYYEPPLILFYDKSFEDWDALAFDHYTDDLKDTEKHIGWDIVKVIVDAIDVDTVKNPDLLAETLEKIIYIYK